MARMLWALWAVVSVVFWLASVRNSFTALQAALLTLLPMAVLALMQRSRRADQDSERTGR